MRLLADMAGYSRLIAMAPRSLARLRMVASRTRCRFDTRVSDNAVPLRHPLGPIRCRSAPRPVVQTSALPRSKTTAPTEQFVDAKVEAFEAYKMFLRVQDVRRSTSHRCGHDCCLLTLPVDGICKFVFCNEACTSRRELGIRRANPHRPRSVGQSELKSWTAPDNRGCT